MPRSVLALFLSLMLLGQTASSRTVLATILDARNRAIVDVGLDDFVVREAGQPREVLDVHVADYPIAVLVDNGSGSRADFDAIQKAAARFITRVGQRPIALGAMSDPPTMLTTFQDERSTVTERLQAMTAHLSADSMVGQSLAAAARAIHESGALFSAIVVISASPVDLAKDPPADMLTTIFDSGAIVHVVANRPVAGRRSTDLLRVVTEQTRGEFTTIYSQASYQIALDHLADRLSTEMMIEYIEPPGAPTRAGAAGVEDVKLGVRIPGAHVRGLGVK